VNFRNNRKRSAENPPILHENPLYNVIGVWCAVSATKFRESIFLRPYIHTSMLQF